MSVRENMCACALQSVNSDYTAANTDTWLIRGQEGVKLLMYAIDNDNEDMLKTLIDRGADPNSKTTVGAGVKRVYAYIIILHGRNAACCNYSHNNGAIIDRKAPPYSHTLLKWTRKPA